MGFGSQPRGWTNLCHVSGVGNPHGQSGSLSAGIDDRDYLARNRITDCRGKVIGGLPSESPARASRSWFIRGVGIRVAITN